MSYDVSIEDHEGNEVCESTNITYNVHPMFKIAFKNKDGIRILNNMAAKAALPLLISAIQDMNKNKEEFELLNPSNGWGSRETTVKALSEIINNVIMNEECIIKIY